MEIRVGNGFDVHAFAHGRKLILGGVDIAYRAGLAGHSDADVLTHAVMDALLGAAGLGDIGQHFPDTDEAYRDADSLELLSDIMGKIRAACWNISNIDATIIAQKPKLLDFTPQMEVNIAEVLRIDVSQVNVKATTTEKLGFTGREEGIAAIVSAALYR